jgi:phosphoenolpyruvate carboxylase
MANEAAVVAKGAGRDLQIALLRGYRDPGLSEESREMWLDPLLRSINAIAAGIRNTG